jgi:hypothetical protein
MRQDLVVAPAATLLPIRLPDSKPVPEGYQRRADANSAFVRDDELVFAAGPISKAHQ